MEQHAVPQNVTTFQFRLIGDMTIKQFGYIAGGALLAYLCYKLPLPLYINWLLAITAALGGFGFAFVPIEERPMDVWVLSFFKSIYSPTLYTWQDQAPPTPAQTVTPPAAALPQQPPAVVPPVPQPTTRRGDILQNIFQPSVPGALHAPNLVISQHKPRGMFDWFFDLFMPVPHAAPAHIPAGQIPRQNFPSVKPVDAVPPTQTAFPSTVHAKMDFTPPPTVQSRDEIIAQTAKKEADVQKQVAVIQNELEGKTLAENRVGDLQKQLADLVRDRDNMEAEIARLRLQSQNIPPPRPTGTYFATPAAKQGPSVRIITPDRAVKAGLPRLTTFPNVVTGIVKDGDQNLLPGVLITVKDKEGVPVRALKTNRLGQFAASTQLTNGTYFVEIEDPRLRYTFDRAQITLNGSIVPALEIFAKSQKEITRAKLEKELFGTKPS